jgi:hypothetical protein
MHVPTAELAEAHETWRLHTVYLGIIRDIYSKWPRAVDVRHRRNFRTSSEVFARVTERAMQHLRGLTTVCPLLARHHVDARPLP